MYTQYLTAPVLRVSSPLSPSRSVPSIYISPADSPARLDTPSLEPGSPEEPLTTRSNHLLPPPAVPPHRRAPFPAKATDKKGLDQTTFQDLLTANRERSSKRLVSPADRLRREVVVKAHHSKQLERRALFLSKITAPPSPTSTETAVTPPESPAIFHFSLPSPGLASPLELFETVTPRERWIEEVNYSKKSLCTPAFPAGRLPSLDQITARLRPAANTTLVVPSIVVESPTPVAVKPLNIIKGNRQDEARPRSRIPDSIIASARARSTSPPTPVARVLPTSDAPSKLIISSSPPKSIKPVLVPQSIPALRVKKPSSPELTPVPVMSWREREAARTPSVVRAHTQVESWRREAPKKDLVRDTVITPVVPQSVMSLPIGTKPAPLLPRETRPKMMTRVPEALATNLPTTYARTKPALDINTNEAVDGTVVSRRGALLRAQKDTANTLKLAETERRTVQGRNMVDKLRRRTSAPAQLEGVLKKGAPVGGF